MAAFRRFVALRRRRRAGQYASTACIARRGGGDNVGPEAVCRRQTLVSRHGDWAGRRAAKRKSGWMPGRPKAGRAMSALDTVAKPLSVSKVIWPRGRAPAGRRPGAADAV